MNRQAWLGLAAIVATGTGVALAAPGAGPGPGGERAPMSMMDGGPGGMMMGVPHPRMLERMAGELQLTEDQKQKLKGIFESARPEMEQVRELGRQNAERLQAVRPGERNYDAVVSEVSRAAGELATRAVTNGAQLRAQVWTVLTPEQRQKMESLQAQRREARQQRMAERRSRMRGAP
jgi:Spy/CpxP family protein refolding chaperone